MRTNARLQIELLGGARITHDGVAINFITSKALALVCYLAVTGRPHFRASLAALFWSEQSEDAARGNLRVVLSNIRQHIGPYLVITRDTIAFDTSSAFSLDTTELDAALQGAPPHDITMLRNAVGLYRSEFLEGFHVRDALDFEEWATIQRERLRQSILHILHELITRTTIGGDSEAAIAYCTRLVELDPWHEDTYRQLMQLLAQNGQLSAALYYYETCRRVLHDDLGIDPSSETVALYQRINDSGASQSQVRESASAFQGIQPRPSTLPTYYTSFVGRDQELAQITTRLRDPMCRLLTLVGPGGIGKTRLALSAASRLSEDFVDGVAFTSLASAIRPEHIVPALMSSLGLEATGHNDAKSLLLHHLHDKSMLLVLDNFEQLMAGLDLLMDILEAGPSLKLLVTSRERLALQAEHLLHVPGMFSRVADASTSTSTNDAVQLFVERAQQVRADFMLTDQDSQSVVQICQMVEGMPLGIELAATWIRTHTCQEIATEIASSLDFLATSLRDVPQRHHSLRIVFDHSWNLLSPMEQEVLQRLSIFRGGFHIEAAHAVAGATLANLISLVDKSLAHRTPAGRYTMHSLMSQYAEQRLAASSDDDDAARSRHRAYIAKLLQSQELALKGQTQPTALNTIESELANVRVAWQSAVTQADVTIIAQMLDVLCLFYDIQGWIQEGETATTQAAERLLALPQTNDATTIVIARLLAWRGRFCHFLGRYDEAEQLIEHGLTLARLHNLKPVIAQCLNTQGSNAGVRGQYERAQTLFLESLAQYRATDDQAGAAEILADLGGVAFDQGDFIEARRWWEEAATTARVRGDRRTLAWLLNNLGELTRFLGDFVASKRLSEESLVMLHAPKHGWQLAGVLCNLGALAQAEGRYDDARRLITEGLEAVRQGGRPRSIGLALLDLANLASSEGSLGEAQTLADEAIMLYRSIGHQRGHIYSLIMLSELARKRDQHHVATSLAEESLARAQEIGDKRAIGAALRSLGQAQTQLGWYSVATESLTSALSIHTSIGTLPEALEVIVDTADLLLQSWMMLGDVAQSMHLTSPDELILERLSIAMSHPASWHSTRTRAEELRMEMSRLLPPDALLIFPIDDPKAALVTLAARKV